MWAKAKGRRLKIEDDRAAPTTSRVVKSIQATLVPPEMFFNGGMERRGQHEPGWTKMTVARESLR
jgi:hypothetical protein